MSVALPARRTALIVVLAAALIAAPLVLDDFVLSVMGSVFLSATVGIAWNLMMGYTGLLSLGHALYFGVGAYAQAILVERYGISPWLALTAAAALPAALGIAAGALSFRFSVGGVYFALLTIAFAEIARIGFEHWPYVGDTAGIFLSALSPANVPLRSLRGGAGFFYYALLIFMALSFGLSVLLVRTRTGYLWRAIREDEDVSRAMGVKTLRYKLLAVAISAGMTGVAGAWFALINGSLFPESVLGMRISIDLIVAPIVGGLGTLLGPIVGAILIVPLGELTRSATQSFNLSGLNLLCYGLALMAIVTVAPQGCWPAIARWLRLDDLSNLGGKP